MEAKVVSTGDLLGQVGKEVGVSPWVELGQERINQFADVTEDHQFIHVDLEKAKTTPFGGTIAHGLLTLSMLPCFAEGALPTLQGIQMGVNYGYDKIRFIQPVPSGSKVRGRFTLMEMSERRPGQWQTKYMVAVEIDGQEKPALTAEWIMLHFVQ